MVMQMSPFPRTWDAAWRRVDAFLELAEVHAEERSHLRRRAYRAQWRCLHHVLEHANAEEPRFASLRASRLRSRTAIPGEFAVRASPRLSTIAAGGPLNHEERRRVPPATNATRP